MRITECGDRFARHSQRYSLLLQAALLPPLDLSMRMPWLPTTCSNAGLVTSNTIVMQLQTILIVSPRPSP